jgi:hypothetical protein
MTPQSRHADVAGSAGCGAGDRAWLRAVKGVRVVD